jgi:polyvinyl alcohol dehydrogenase (cytochrome)
MLHLRTISIAVALGATIQSGFPQQAVGQAVRRSEGEGARTFGDRCASCHGNPKVPAAPDPLVLKRMTPEHIYQVLTVGDMKDIAKNVPDPDKRAIATFLGGRRMNEGDQGAAKAMPNVCPANLPVRSLTAVPAWNGWGVDISNTRFQSARGAGLQSEDVPRLKLKWAFGFPEANSLYNQPTIVDGRVFVSSDSGYVYSLDAASGCVHWSFQAQAGVRGSITIAPVKGGSTKFAAYFGDVHGNVYSIDASNGELLWKVPVDPHPLSRITGAPVLYEGRVYVPVASLEEVESGSANYNCCTFRGMLVALNSETGKQVWKTYTIAETPHAIRKNSLGKDVMGPSGAGVWCSPALDPKRHAIYIETGNAFSDPPTETSDAVMALDMDSGKVLWSVQATANDVWHGSCGRGLGNGRNPGSVHPSDIGLQYPEENCPENGGPDQDFSGGAILATMPTGRNIVVAGQKPGIVWGLDPDKKGAVIWKVNIARARGNAGIIFGGAADNQSAYFNLRSGGAVAIQLSDGKEKWFTPVTAPETMKNHAGASAAVTVIPGVMFSAGLDGVLRAFSAADGKPLWDFNTDREFETVNKVAARGGSMGSAGAIVANGMVFVGSGYIGFQNGVPGNVLLAFAP